MSKVYTDTVTSTEASQDLTLGGSGDNVIVTAGATLKTNTVKDSGGNTLWTSDGSGNLSSINAAMAGNMVLLSTQTASNSTSVSFTSGIDSTYKLYIFKCINIHASHDHAHLLFQANVAGASGYNEPVTSTSFNAHHSEADNVAALVYDTGWDQATTSANSGTGNHLLIKLGTGNDEAGSGELFLFNPSNTTYVKHWYSRGVTNSSIDRAYDNFQAGYFNVTGAIDEIQFTANVGNLDAGTIKMYGLG